MSSDLQATLDPAHQPSFLIPKLKLEKPCARFDLTVTATIRPGMKNLAAASNSVTLIAPHTKLEANPGKDVGGDGRKAMPHARFFFCKLKLTYVC